MVYYVCRVLKYPTLGEATSKLEIEIVDCKVPTLNPNFFNKGFNKRELAEEYIKGIAVPAFDYIVVYQPQ